MGSLNYSATIHTHIMKFLVLSACVALTSAQLVTHPNGAVVPLDTPEVAAAKAAHLGAHGLPLAYPVPYGHGYVGHPYGLVGYAYHGHLGYAYGYPYAGLVAHPNGAVVPAEPADLVAARAAHLAAHAAA